jgi:hypothetical protein
LFGPRFRGFPSPLAPAGQNEVRARRVRRRPQLEHLEGRALLSNITASGVFSATPDGPNFDVSIQVSNSNTSDSAIGTFWYAWIPVPDQNFLASRPISVTPPAGWTDKITNDGPTDGFGIEFIASNSTSFIQPGSSLTFNFTTADSPAALRACLGIH